MSVRVASLVRSPKRQTFLNKAVAEYASQLADSAIGVEYWESRGFSPEIQARWRLGFVADPLPEHARFVGWVTIPYYTPSGYAAIKFRCAHTRPECDAARVLNPKHRKYMQEVHAQDYLFNAHILSRGYETVYVCEGELDAIMASTHGLPSIAISGVDKWQEHWSWCFDGVDDLVLLADGDEPGFKMYRSLKSKLPQLRLVQMPPGEDVSSVVMKQGPEALEMLIGDSHEED